MTKMKTHWVADIFPLNDDDVCRLAEDIKANGQQIPIITLDDGTIVDGRTRWLACEKAGVKPVVEVIENGNDDELLKRSWSLNESRRHLSTSQRACVAAEVIERLPEEAKGKGANRRTGNQKAISGVLDQFAAGKEIVRQARVLLKGEPSLHVACKGGTMTVSEAYREHQHKEQDTKAKSEKAKQIRDKAPDLAERYLDEADELTFDGAVKQYAERVAKEEKEEKEYEELQDRTRLRFLEGVAVFSNWDNDQAQERVVEALNGSADKEQVRATITNLRKILKRL